MRVRRVEQLGVIEQSYDEMVDELTISESVVEGVCAAVRANGGVTYDIIGGRVYDGRGFGVALYGAEYVLPVGVSLEQGVRYYYEQNCHYLESPNFFLGVWQDGDRTVFDVSVIYGTLADAVVAGIERKQDAIYDFARGESLYLWGLGA